MNLRGLKVRSSPVALHEPPDDELVASATEGNAAAFEKLMRRYNQRCATQGHRVWLYGGRDQGHLVQLALRLRQDHPGIKIVGGYAPPFRPLTMSNWHVL